MIAKPKTKRTYIRPISKAAFDKMTPARKRVALAKDVIARLNAKTIVPTWGTYLSPCDYYLRDELEGKPKSELRKLDGKTFVTENKCNVCAKGSIILAWAANFNQVKMDKIYEQENLKELKGIFPSAMWDTMENAFEWRGWSLHRIMKNLIDNKGAFKFQGNTYND